MLIQCSAASEYHKPKEWNIGGEKKKQNKTAVISANHPFSPLHIKIKKTDFFLKWPVTACMLKTELAS